MNPSSLLSGFATALFLLPAVAGEIPQEQPEAVTIPLDQIWAYEMPGTRDVRQLEQDKSGYALRKNRKSFTSQILQSLPIPSPGQKATPGFAVLGIGQDALREAHSVLVSGQKPRKDFPPGSIVSVVFFSHRFGFCVHLHKVERIGNTIRVYFRFVPHRTKVLTIHFALIPLGELSPGKVIVEIVRSPMEASFVNAGFKSPDAGTESRVVSQSFDFLIEEAKR